MVTLFSQEKKFICENCGADILIGNDRGPGIIVLVEDENSVTYDVYASCKGKCDETLKRSRARGGSDGWRDVVDFTNPLLFVKYTMSGINLANQQKFTPEALEQYKQILFVAFQHVLREPTKGELDQYDFESSLPF
ncbi:hypothetical protein MKX41_10970 [Paenibacillus sp. FSL R5-0475]|uniref:hypothetical protein n=1 Tax=Paenibacillus sp. FSL R5-0475 TaxID=2921643 RepID=UPI0030F8B3C0